jgi:hypothetical protein
MKLYATTTSERATKGQGGKYLNIQLSGEDNQPLGVISIRYQEDKKEYYGLYTHDNKIISIFHIEKQ